jgi:hypothetical protein
MLVLGLGLKAKIFGLGFTGLVNMNKATCAFSGGGGGEFGYTHKNNLLFFTEKITD